MMSMTRKEDESWHDALMRIAAPWQLEHQVDALWQEFRADGESEKYAAFSAAYELDLLEFTDSDTEELDVITPEEPEEDSDEDEDSIGVEVQEFFEGEDEAAGGDKPGREL
jgi:hypothetical protein